MNSSYLPDSSLLECSVIFVKYSASVVPLIFPPKTLILDKVGFNSIKFAKSRDRKDVFQKYLTILFLHPIYRSYQSLYALKAINKKLENFTQVLISIFFY